MTKIAIFGAGLVGQRTARSLAATTDHQIVLVAQTRPLAPIEGIETAVGWPNDAASKADVVVLATESAHQVALARELIRTGTNVVTTADDPLQVERLWSLESLAQTHRVTLIVGASYSPGLSTLLAACLARSFDTVSTIRTAQFGTGGPACAREHHRAMSATAREVHGGLLRTTRGGSGRELVWFPEPVGAADCYRAGLADPFLLHQEFPGVSRIESRQAATRRDRLTSRLPMLRPPHPEGLVGAVWAEVRGRTNGRVEHRALAATAPQATGAAALAAAWCHELATTTMRAGVRSAASRDTQVSLLQHVSSDVRLWTYDGSHVDTNTGVNTPIQAARKWRIPGENPVIATIF